MRYSVKTINSTYIDIIIAVARQGGVENVVSGLALYLRELGFCVRVIQFIRSDIDWVDSSIEVLYVYDSPDGHDLSDFCSEYKKILTNGVKPDLVLAVAWPYMSYVAKEATSELGINATVVSYMHAELQKYVDAGYGGVEALAYADAHFAISNNIKNDIEREINNSICYRVNNPIDNTPAENINNMNPMKLCYVGRLSKEKQLDTLIRALKKVSHPYELCLVGDGDEKSRLLHLSKKLGVKDRVHFLGWQDSPWEAVRECSICLLSSIYEGFSLTSVEALARGKVLIGTPVSGVIELVRPGENGYIYPIGAYEELAKLLDMIAEGRLPNIDPLVCKESAIPFYRENAFGDMAMKIFSLSQKRVLQHSTVNLPKISVIVPCFNCVDTIATCLDSILNSSIGLGALEIIAVDDASTDDTLSVLMEYEKKYPDNLLVINCEENGRQGKARNIGLGYASGEYISFVDSDDYIEPDMLIKLVIYAETFGVDIAECTFKEFPDAFDQTNEKYTQEDSLLLRENDEDAAAIFLGNAILVSIWTKLYRRSFLQGQQVYFPEGMFMEDVFFSQVLMSEVSSIYKTGEKLYNYYINPNSTMRSEKLKDYYMDVFYAQRLVIEEIIKRGTFDIYKESLERALKMRTDDLKIFMDSLPEFPTEHWKEITDYINFRFPK